MTSLTPSIKNNSEARKPNPNTTRKKVSNENKQPNVNPEKTEELLAKLQKVDDSVRNSILKDIKDLNSHKPKQNYYAFSSWSQCGWSERS